METEQKSELLSPDQLAMIAQSETQKLVKAYDNTKIRSDKSLKEATELLSRIKAISKEVKAQKDSVIRPINESLKHIRMIFSQPETMLNKIERELKEQILGYHNRVEAAAARKAAELEVKVDAGEMGLSEGVGKLSKIKQAQTNIESETGKAQIRTTYKIEIKDLTLIPRGTLYSILIREPVMEAIRRELTKDILREKKPTPDGVEVIEVKGVAAF